MQLIAWHLSRPQMRVLALLVLATLLCFTHVYFLRQDVGGIVIWNDSEAYVFVSVVRKGRHVSCIYLPWFIVRESLGAIDQADNNSDFNVVLKLTRSGVERYIFKHSETSVAFLTPLNGQIFGNCAGRLCRWDGSRLRDATLEERESLGGLGHLTTQDVDRDSFGWSKRNITDRTLALKIGDFGGVEVTSLNSKESGSGFAVALSRPGKSEFVVTFAQLDGPVWRSQYYKLFRGYE